MRQIVTLPLCVGLLLSGCVMPGPLDKSMVGRYQRAMSERGPQSRGSDGLEQLRPADTTRPPLQIAHDEETGRTRVLLSLDEAVLRALSNSLDIRLASYDPAVSREEMIQAASVFDAIVFGQFQYSDNTTQLPTTRTIIQPSEMVRTDDSSRIWQAGITQRTPTGANWQLAWNLTRTYDERRSASRQRLYSNSVALELTQPLLRNAWPEFNLANLRVARLTYKVSEAEFRRQVEQVVSDVIAAYWLLVQARRDWVIQKALLDRTIETRDRIDKRRAVDATEVEYKQAEAAVETRRAGLIQAQKQIVDTQDQLVRLIADAELSLLNDYDVVPTTRPNTDFVQFDVTDQLLTALRHSPLLEQARLAVAVADINVGVAKNQALPRLDFTFGATLEGVDRGPHEARKSLETADYASYTFGLEAEYPIGNRNRMAEVRRQKIDRLRSITTLQNASDTIAVQVRERIRQIEATHEEMIAQRRAVEASREQLDALDATEQLRRMTPEFLQVKLSAQESLSNAARAELRAIVDYNIALVTLAQVTGTVLELNHVELSMPAVLGEAEWNPDALREPDVNESQPMTRPAASLGTLLDGRTLGRLP